MVMQPPAVKRNLLTRLGQNSGRDRRSLPGSSQRQGETCAALILTMFLETSGILDWHPQVYAVPTTSFPAAYFRDKVWRAMRFYENKK
ncbi:hypothetical protein BBB56_10060 [Candidatus Pantoea deserta]|uniref:Uncharacterized protein n=1 Tax=Candidatus Pantoea deserta TaxID=1869313 RepID=A0A3N4P1Z6_9GAMM|nr:hypothetical protein BBB56_10060 [Pantoea deserta]